MMRPHFKSRVAPSLLLPPSAVASPTPAKSVRILNFLVTNRGTEVSRTNDVHEDKCTSNQVFAGSDPIIILLRQDHLTERPETFLCLQGIIPLLFQSSWTNRVFIFVCVRCLFWIFVIYPAPHLGLEQLRERTGCVYFFISHGAEPRESPPQKETNPDCMTDRIGVKKKKPHKKPQLILKFTQEQRLFKQHDPVASFNISRTESARLMC